MSTFLLSLPLQVTAIEATEDLSEPQLLGQSGGNLLRSETAAFSLGGRKIRKATPMLLAALQRDALIFPLFVLIAQQRNVIMFKHDAVAAPQVTRDFRFEIFFSSSLVCEIFLRPVSG